MHWQISVNVNLSTCRSVNMSICWPVNINASTYMLDKLVCQCPYINLSMCQHVDLSMSTCQWIDRKVCQCQPVNMSIYQYVYLSMNWQKSVNVNMSTCQYQRVNALTDRTRHVFVKHGCPQRQDSQNIAKISKSYISTPPPPQGACVMFSGLILCLEPCWTCWWKTRCFRGTTFIHKWRIHTQVLYKHVRWKPITDITLLPAKFTVLSFLPYNDL